MNFTPEQMAAAQAQVANMSPEQMQAMIGNMGPAQKAQMRAMGMDPGMLDSLQKNPEMMKMGMDQMKNATPEQMAQQARMAQAKMASNKPAASKKPLKLKGEGKPAEVLKNEGNGFYAAQQFGEAVKKYEAALVALMGLDFASSDEEAALWTVKDACHLNMAQCFLKTKQFGRVERECTEVLSRQPNFKAYFRRGQARVELGQLESGEKDLARALDLHAGDAHISAALGKVREQMAAAKQELGEEEGESEGNKAAAEVQEEPEEEEDVGVVPAASMSVRQLKALLDQKSLDYEGVADKIDLVSMAMANFSPEEISKHARTMRKTAAEKEADKAAVPPSYPTQAAPSGGLDASQVKKASEALAGMSPEQLRAQAQMMKGMAPATLRAMNPQFAAMSDAQLQGAIKQMEMMADNPAMMQMAAQQMQNMTPEQLAQVKQMTSGGSPGGASAAQQPGAAAPAAAAANPMAGMAEMMNNNPADMSNEQKMNMAQDMMKNMSPEQMQNMMKMQRDMLKNNPEMFKQMAASNPAMAGMSAEQMAKQLDTMADMDPEQLKRMMGMAQKVQGVAMPVINLWQRFNGACNGHGATVLVALLAMLLYNYFYGSPF